MLELLLNSGHFSPRKESPSLPFIPHSNGRRYKRKRASEKSAGAKEGNNGYYVIVHDDQETTPGHSTNRNASESTTPEDMDNLEWDLEVRENSEPVSTSEEEDVWSNQYRWYAKILANTYCSVVEMPNICDVNLQDSIGRCAIHYAAEYGHVNAVKLLINAGAKVDMGDVDSLTALHLAANKGHYSVVETLLTSGALVNCKTTDKLSALHYAASRGHARIVQILIDRGANVDSLDATDRTPLKLAVSRNLYDVAKVLVERGARVNIEDIKSYTPLCEAVWQKSVKMAELLLDAGAKLTPTPYLLHYAILHQHYEMVELLLRYGSLVNIRDNHGNTPLITASITSQTKMVKLLLSYGAHVDCCGSTSEKTPLSAAIAWSGHTSEDVVRALVEGGADLDRECWAESPLSSALLNNKLKVAGLLISLGADVTKSMHRTIVSRDALSLARRFLCFRYNLFLVKDVEYPSKWPTDTDTVEGWLQYQKFNPLGLAELCRIKIRSFAGKTFMEKFVKGLNLPPFLVKYILMQDILVTEPVIPQSAKVSLLPLYQF
ncbi:hypothetical protein AAG570_001835 [Ranatra chinensis]|uniref:SOCS box domain-containing protein n=1 Tax=Ranatra chinensis TaxID=642074 RepID=A0ABD0Y9N7_9HEMI